MYLGLSRYLRRRRRRQDVTAFDAFIGKVGPLALPANATLYVEAINDISQQVAATANEEDVYAPNMKSGERHSLGWFERGVVITPQAGFVLLLDSGLGRLVPVGGEEP